jgi:hypothetical protein
MAKYKLTQKAYINNQYLSEGTVVIVADDFVPGEYMIPMDGAAKKMAKEIGLVSDAPKNYVDEITGAADVTKFGASPQQGTGITYEPNGAEATGVHDLRAPVEER